MITTFGHDLRQRPPAPVYDLAAARRRRQGDEDPPPEPAEAAAREVA